MGIENRLINIGDDSWYSTEFKSVLEDHMTYLRQHDETRIQIVEPSMLVKYRFDLYGMFMLYSLEPFSHWTIMRMNNYYSPTEDFSDMYSFIYPSSKTLTQILQHYKTRNRARGS